MGILVHLYQFTVYSDICYVKKQKYEQNMTLQFVAGPRIAILACLQLWLVVRGAALLLLARHVPTCDRCQVNAVSLPLRDHIDVQDTTSMYEGHLDLPLSST